MRSRISVLPLMMGKTLTLIGGATLTVTMKGKIWELG